MKTPPRGQPGMAVFRPIVSPPECPPPARCPTPPDDSANLAGGTYPRRSRGRWTNWRRATTPPRVGRPSPLYHAERLSRLGGGAQIYFKREDLNHTGAHKINNTLGQALLTLRMGKPRVIAETGAGQHGVATATACAHFGLECVVYMGEEDIRRQRLNVFNMRMMGAQVRPVTSGSRTLRDAINEALRDWMSSVEHTHYIIGSVVGPHPFPRIVRDFQAVIGEEIKKDFLARRGSLPNAIVACVGGG